MSLFLFLLSVALAADFGAALAGVLFIDLAFCLAVGPVAGLLALVAGALAVVD